MVSDLLALAPHYTVLAMIQYRVSYENPLTSYLQIELNLDI